MLKGGMSSASENIVSDRSASIRPLPVANHSLLIAKYWAILALLVAFIVATFPAWTLAIA